MKTYRYISALTAAAIASVASPALAQFDFSFEEKPPWENFTLNKSARVQMDFRNASIDAVIQMLSKASGVTIIKDPNLNGGITLQSPKPQSLTDAFSMLNTTLSLRNYTLAKDGNFLVIRPRNQRGGGGGFTAFSGRSAGGQEQSGELRGGGRFGGGDDQPQLRVYPIKHANASQVARVVNEVFAIPTTPPNPAAAMAAAAAAQQAQAQGGGGGNNRRGGGGGGGFGGFGGRRGGFGGAAAGPSAVKASADDFSNSLIVNAPERQHEQIRELIEQIDKQTEQPQQTRVFPLQYASAVEIAPVIQNVLVSNAPRGRGGIGSQNVPIDQRFQQAARFGSAQAAFGTVVPELRTNSVVVTATQDNLQIVDQIIKQLDTEVSFESSTFVVTLENARADVMAQLLNQSFGGRTGGGGNFGGQGRFNQGRTGGNNRQQRRQGGGGGFGGGGGGGGFGGGGRAAETPEGGSAPGSGGRAEPEPDPTELRLDLDDPGAESGDLATNVTVKQGGAFDVAQLGGGGFRGGGQQRGGFFGGGQGGRAQQPAGATGLDAQGRVVNVRDLTGDVVVVPDINTNSVIIVTSPENRALLESILNQLDRIPEQVMIETLIVEASLDASNKLGVEWNFTQQGNAFGIGGAKGSGTTAFGNRANTAQPQGLRYTLAGNQYEMFLQALQSDSRFEVLSTPRIFTSNNATAEINISQSLPYVLNQRVDNNGNILFNYAFLDVGIILTVTPRITSNGYVTMDVTQTANDFVRYTEFNAPVVNQREAQTTVSVRDGETIVLGGIIKNSVATTVNKVPLLGDIPLLGSLFRSKDTTKNKTELLVFLTPRVVRNEEEARRLRERTQGQLQSDVQKKIEKAIPAATTTTTAPAPSNTATPPPVAPVTPAPPPSPTPAPAPVP